MYNVSQKFVERHGQAVNKKSSRHKNLFLLVFEVILLLCQKQSDISSRLLRNREAHTLPTTQKRFGRRLMFQCEHFANNEVG